jgi:hypothetical protein
MKECRMEGKKLLTFIHWWLVGMLFVSRSGLVEDDAVEVFHYLFLDVKFHFFSEKIIMW